MEILRQKNVASYIVFPIVDADGDLVTGATGLDSEIDTWSDGAAPDGFTDCTNEATEIGSTGQYYLSLTNTELNVDYAIIQIKTSSVGAKTQTVLIRTQVGDPLNNAVTDDGTAINVASGIVEAQVKSIDANAITATAINADAITAAKIAADVTTEIQSGLATAAALATVDGIVDDILVDTGTTLQAELDGIQTDTEDIQSRLPAALTANGNMKSSLVEILTTALTESAGLIAAGFKKFFNVATPTGTVNSLPDAVPGASGGVFIAGANSITLVDIVGDITGSLSGTVSAVTGAVGSVTGAVGSVTGNVGGNVTGSIGSLAAQAKADVNAEVDSALDTAIPASPTANSVNERVKAIDDKLPSGTISDLTAAQVNAEADTALSDVGLTTTITGRIDAAISSRLATGTVASDVTAIKNKTDNLPAAVKKNTALANFPFLLVDSTDHVTGKTGRTVTATRSIDGAAFAACANSVTEVSNGIYKINLAAADLNGDTITLRFTATSADDRFITIATQT
jgi:hypothetical protein